MSSTTAQARPATNAGLGISLPLPVLLVLGALAIGIGSGLAPEEVVRRFGQGFGRSLGDFALILLPSFLIAASLSHRALPAMGGAVRYVAPFASAGMICHITAYAALAPLAGAQRLSMAMAAFAGFLLLVPAGPLIVGASLGIDDPSIYVLGLVLLVPVVLAGEAWLRLFPAPAAPATAREGGGDWAGFAPFGVLAGALLSGWLLPLHDVPLLGFLTQPKGALLLAGIAAWLGTPAHLRRECVDSAVRRTTGLMLLVGAAGAFGFMATSVVPVASLLPQGEGGHVLGVFGLFAAASALKMLQGSSMATFAALGPLVAPVVAHLGLPPALAVYAICAGCFVTILPNDNYYWLVRRDALEAGPERAALQRLTGAATCQGVAALAALLGLWVVGVVA